MLNLVPVPPKTLSDYAAVVGSDVVAELRRRAEPYQGAKVLHLSSTAFGGGVAELLVTQVPLMNDLGMEVEWRLLEGHEAFFTVTKAMHNGLQGAEVAFTSQMTALYDEVNQQNAGALADDYDFIIVHDPQPAALPTVSDEVRARGKRWIWRCHIDLTAPYEPVWSFLSRSVETYDAAIFTMQDFVPTGFEIGNLCLMTPTIDPLSLKNIPMDDEMVNEVTHRYGVDPARPLVVQVSRFDPWKDPTGVIDAFRAAREDIAGLQLVMVASMAHDDPEGWHYFTVTEEHRAGDPDVFLLSNLQEVGALEVNAFQRAADVILQKSLREGFGMTVTEGMWKRTPVIGGNVGGIRLQIEDGVSGFLVDDVEACAARIVDLIKDPDLARSIGEAGRATVRDRYLTMRNLTDFLDLFDSLNA